MKKIIILLLLIILLFTSFGELLYSRSGSARFKNVKKWKGTIHYKLDLKDLIYDNSISFMKLKGLSGQTMEKVLIDGEVTFQLFRNKNTNSDEEDLTFGSPENTGFFVGKGKVKYNVSIVNVSRIGNAMVVHLTSGKGQEKVEPIRYINYLRIDYSTGTYSLHITPGISDEEMDAFGVYVESVSEMKITRALINKMEENNRKIPFPELLKEMFPDVIKNSSRESIAAEAFGITLPSSGSTLQGSYTDEKGGIFTWKLTPYN